MTTTSRGEDEAWISNKQPEDNNGDTPQIRYKQDRGLLKTRTTLEKILLGVLALVLLVLLIVVILFIVSSNNKHDNDAVSSGPKSSASSGLTPDVVTHQNVEICLTKGCINAASRLDQDIDYSVSPCEDFHQFACGRWMKKHAIPEDQASYNRFSILREQVQVVLRNLLQEEHKPGDLDCMKKAKDLYASCVDTEKIEKRGDHILKDTLVQELGGWPLTHKDWSSDQFDIVNTMVKLKQMGTNPVIAFYVSFDSMDSSTRILTMNQPSFGMPGQKYYQVSRDDVMLKAYEELIRGVASLMGLANPETAEKDINDIIEFEILLANISVPDEERRDSTKLYNPMTLGEVHGNYSQVFDWRRFVHTLLNLPEVQVLDVTDDERIINKAPSYFRKLNTVLQDVDKRVLANYMVWRAVKGMIGLQGEQYAALSRKYHKVLTGTSAESARFRDCASYTTMNLDQCVGRMFVKDNFRAEAKDMVLEMIRDLHESFNELLDQLDWMDETTKRVAREKNDFISPKIGYPEQVMNDTFLNELYQNLTYFRDTYFENSLENRRQGFSKSFRELRKPYDKTIWDGTPSTVNAFYSPVKNQIMFPAGILQPPFFSMTYPKSLNFGGIGYLIGHEISHGFDDEGRQYDKHGNLAEWWDQSVIDKFKAKTQCVIDQYGNFTVPEIGMNLNGVNTQGENIADNGGLKQAFRAYRNWVARTGKEEPLLPGLGFTHNQLFFINFAQLWCVLTRDAAVINSIRTGMHSPGRFRVIGTVQNSPEFAQAFNCPAGSSMNPGKKCTVW